jgi:hypothetical protein
MASIEATADHCVFDAVPSIGLSITECLDASFAGR